MFINYFPTKLKVLWSDGEADLPEKPNGYAYLLKECSSVDPYNDWYIWADENFIE